MRALKFIVCVACAAGGFMAGRYQARAEFPAVLVRAHTEKSPTFPFSSVIGRFERSVADDSGGRGFCDDFASYGNSQAEKMGYTVRWYCNMETP